LATVNQVAGTIDSTIKTAAGIISGPSATQANKGSADVQSSAKLDKGTPTAVTAGATTPGTDVTPTSSDAKQAAKDAKAADKKAKQEAKAAAAKEKQEAKAAAAKEKQEAKAAAAKAKQEAKAAAAKAKQEAKDAAKQAKQDAKDAKSASKSGGDTKSGAAAA
jgi:hypothetical protein